MRGVFAAVAGALLTYGCADMGSPGSGGFGQSVGPGGVKQGAGPWGQSVGPGGVQQGAGPWGPGQSVGPEGVRQCAGPYGPCQTVGPGGVYQGMGAPPSSSTSSRPHKPTPAQSCNLHCDSGDVSVSCPAGTAPSCHCEPEPQAMCVSR
jgi:hypothetical protein